MAKCYSYYGSKISIDDLIYNLNKFCPTATTTNTQIDLDINGYIDCIYIRNALPSDIELYGQHLSFEDKQKYFELAKKNDTQHMFDNLTLEQWREHFEQSYRW